jgi:hypothetical protein
LQVVRRCVGLNFRVGRRFVQDAKLNVDALSKRSLA